MEQLSGLGSPINTQQSQNQKHQSNIKQSMLHSNAISSQHKSRYAQHQVKQFQNNIHELLINKLKKYASMQDPQLLQQIELQQKQIQDMQKSLEEAHQLIGQQQIQHILANAGVQTSQILNISKSIETSLLQSRQFQDQGMQMSVIQPSVNQSTQNQIGMQSNYMQTTLPAQSQAEMQATIGGLSGKTLAEFSADQQSQQSQIGLPQQKQSQSQNVHFSTHIPIVNSQLETDKSIIMQQGNINYKTGIPIVGSQIDPLKVPSMILNNKPLQGTVQNSNDLDLGQAHTMVESMLQEENLNLKREIQQLKRLQDASQRFLRQFSYLVKDNDFEDIATFIRDKEQEIYQFKQQIENNSLTLQNKNESIKNLNEQIRILQNKLDEKDIEIMKSQHKLNKSIAITEQLIANSRAGSQANSRAGSRSGSRINNSQIANNSQSTAIDRSYNNRSHFGVSTIASKTSRSVKSPSVQRSPVIERSSKPLSDNKQKYYPEAAVIRISDDSLQENIKFLVEQFKELPNKTALVEEVLNVLIDVCYGGKFNDLKAVFEMERAQNFSQLKNNIQLHWKDSYDELIQQFMEVQCQNCQLNNIIVNIDDQDVGVGTQLGVELLNGLLIGYEFAGQGEVPQLQLLRDGITYSISLE